MAKSAKVCGEVEVTERTINKFDGDILKHYENIESARGRFMNAARKERDGMVALATGMAARGVSQKAAKTHIKIIRALEKIKGWTADLEVEDRKMVTKLAKAQGDKRQLMLFNELPPIPKPTKEEREAAKEANDNGRKSKVDLAEQPPAGAA